MLTFLVFSLMTAASLRYLHAVANIGDTRPSLAAMMVFVVGLFSALASSFALGAHWTALSALGINLTLNSLVIGYMLLRKVGHLSFTTFEKVGIGLLVAGDIAWLATGNAWLALIVPVFVDILGVLFVLAKLRRDPGSEDWPAWALIGAGYGLSLLGMPTWEAKDTLYAGVNSLLCLSVAVAALRKPVRT